MVSICILTWSTEHDGIIIYLNFFQPLRAVILGAPASGKTTVAKQLCDFFKLHHILIKDVIDDELEGLVSSYYTVTYQHILEYNTDTFSTPHEQAYDKAKIYL